MVLRVPNQQITLRPGLPAKGEARIREVESVEKRLQFETLIYRAALPEEAGRPTILLKETPLRLRVSALMSYCLLSSTPLAPLR